MFSCQNVIKETYSKTSLNISRTMQIKKNKKENGVDVKLNGSTVNTKQWVSTWLSDFFLFFFNVLCPF